MSQSTFDFDPAHRHDPTLRRPPVSAPYVVGSATSRQAAESLSPDHLADQARQVYECIKAHRNGMTCDDVEVETGLLHQACSARIRGLESDGWIVKAGKQRPTRSGRNAEVYIHVEPDA